MTQGIKKKAHTSGYKFRVAIEAIKGTKTVSELCSEYSVVSSQIYKWKKALLDHGSEVFVKQKQVKSEDVVRQLHEAIGKLKVENDFLSKFAGVDR